MMYMLVEAMRIPLLAATTVSAEITIVLRFLINDRWVFGYKRPTWNRLLQFHVASAGGGVVWWAVANTLPHFGVHYLIASITGTACSVCFSMATNFFWIWRDRTRTAKAAASLAGLDRAEAL
jgi:putative flippase GtrA